MRSVNSTVSFKEHVLKTGTAQVQEYSAENDTYVRKSQLKEIWGRFCKNKIALAGLICLILLVTMALCADLIAPQGYDNQDLYNQFATNTGLAPTTWAVTSLTVWCMVRASR